MLGRMVTGDGNFLKIFMLLNPYIYLLINTLICNISIIYLYINVCVNI